MTHASRWLRRVEMTLWVLGISLVGFALGATLNRWHYQAQQERALFQEGPSVSAVAQQHVLAVVPQPAGSAEVDEPARIEPVAALQPVERKRPDPTAFGRIEIPRLGVAAIVREGADEGTLSRAVGLVPGSARPGESGNMVLAGHRDTFFRPLRKLKLNDRIRLVAPSHIYEYRVESLRVVTPEETSVLDSRGVEELTLVTCYPFRFLGPAPDRFIVSATRIN